MLTGRGGPAISLSLILPIAALICSPALFVSAARAQELGVVTTLTGTATLARAAQSQPLRFRERVFEQDKIATAEKSLVRVLLGGKAIVTVRELSELTITEGRGKSIVHLASGKVGIAVARERMQPGEEIEVRTPNAVAAVRGTVFVVELVRAADTIVTNVHVLRGIVDVSPSSGASGAPTVRVGAGQSVDVAGTAVGQVQPFSPATMTTVFGDLKSGEPGEPRGAGGLAELVSGRESAKAHALALALSPDPTPQPVGRQAGGAGGEPQQGAQGDNADDPFGIAQLAAAPGNDSSQGAGSGGTATVMQPPLVPPLPAQGLAFSGTQANLPLSLYPFSGESRSFAGTLYTVDAKSKADLDRAVVRSESSALNFSAGIVDIHGSLTAMAAEPLLVFDKSTVTMARLTQVSGSEARLTTSGGLLDASNTTLHAEGASLLAVDGKGSLTSKGKTPLLVLTGGSLTLEPGTDGVAVEKSGRLSLAGALLAADGTDITTADALLRVASGGRVSLGRFKAAVIQLTGGVHVLATDGDHAIVELSGQAKGKDKDTGLRLSRDRPPKTAGPILDAEGATVATRQVLRVDTALLEASLPIIRMRSGSQLTAETGVLDLAMKSKVTSAGPPVSLEASRLVVNKGAAITLSGGSFLKVTGDLFTLANGSTLSLLSGPLVSLSRGSILSVSGALVAFAGKAGGNLLSVSNDLCGGPCTLIGGIPIAFTGGATAANVTIGGDPVRNGALGALKLASPSTALIAVDGKTTKVVVAGK